MKIPPANILEWIGKREGALEAFLASPQYEFLLLRKGKEKIEEREIPGMPSNLYDALLEAHEKTRFPAIAVLPRSHSYFPLLLSGTFYTQAFPEVPDNIVFLSKEAVRAVGDFNPTLTGQAQILEYLARINKKSGFVSDHFITLRANYYADFIPEGMDTREHRRYNKCLEDIKRGLGLFRKIDD